MPKCLVLGQASLRASSQLSIPEIPPLGSWFKSRRHSTRIGHGHCRFLARMQPAFSCNSRQEDQAHVPALRSRLRRLHEPGTHLANAVTLGTRIR